MELTSERGKWAVAHLWLRPFQYSVCRRTKTAVSSENGHLPSFADLAPHRIILIDVTKSLLRRVRQVGKNDGYSLEMSTRRVQSDSFNKELLLSMCMLVYLILNVVRPRSVLPSPLISLLLCTCHVAA